MDVGLTPNHVKNYCVLCCLCYLCCCCYSVLADCSRSIASELQEVGLQGPDKEAPTSHRIPRINNEPSRPTEGVRFCLSERPVPFYQQVLFESNTRGLYLIRTSVSFVLLLLLLSFNPLPKVLSGRNRPSFSVMIRHAWVKMTRR